MLVALLITLAAPAAHAAFNFSVTTGGTAQGRACELPFQYNNQWYYNCTCDASYYVWQKPACYWCSVTKVRCSGAQ